MNQYEELFKVIGHTYKQEGDQDENFFRVPDMRNLFVRGVKDGRQIGTVQEEETNLNNTGL